MTAPTSDGQTQAGLGGDSAGSQPEGWSAMRRQPVPADNLSASPELHAFYSEDWWTAEGARLKLRRLQQAGLPDFTNWRFVTVTVANRMISPLAAYHLGNQRMRRFLARFRKAIGRPFLWCWKLEFHEDGYPHWHILIDYRKRIPVEMLGEIERWWGLGRTNVGRVKESDIHYVFKYVAKGPEDLPEWVAHHRGRLRVFQASRGFYTKRQKRTVKKEEPKSCVVPTDLINRTAWNRRKALLVETDQHGSKRVSVVKLRMTFGALQSVRAYESILRRVQLAPPGVVNISQLQAAELKHEHRKFTGLAGIPTNAALA